MKGLDLLAAKVNKDDTEISLWSWAVVTATAPLRVKLDNESTALPITPDTLVSGLAVGNRVWVQLITNDNPSRRYRRLLIQGKAAGLPVAAVTTFTPALLGTTGNPTQGTGGSSSGKWVIDPVTGIVDCTMMWRFGTSGIAIGSGEYEFELPHIIDSSFHTSAGINGVADLLGVGVMRDNTGPTVYPISAFYFSTTGGPNGRTLVKFYNASGVIVTPTAPFTLDVQDAIRVNLRYRVAV